jgi:hypothetical protein
MEISSHNSLSSAQKGPSAFRRFSALSLTALLLLSVLLGSFHHHNDEQDHPDCSICAVSHHQSAAPGHIPNYTPPALTCAPTVFATATRISISAHRITSQSRAPPA